MQDIKNPKTIVSRSHIIRAVANRHDNLTYTTIAIAVKHIFEIMTHTLANGNKIELRGFGSFSTRFRSARKVRDPRTGQKINLPSRYVVHFKPGKELNAKINKLKSIKKK